MYYDKTNRLEKLFDTLVSNGISEKDALLEFYVIRDGAKETEGLDMKINVKQRRRLMRKADKIVNKYVKEYYNEQSTGKSGDTAAD